MLMQPHCEFIYFSCFHESSDPSVVEIESGEGRSSISFPNVYICKYKYIGISIQEAGGEEP